MSLAYPIARSLEEATQPGVKTARSLSEAVSLSPGYRVERLETGWLHLPAAEATALLAAQGADGPAGHLQRYEDTSGHVVIAVSWWLIADPKSPPKPRPAPPPPPETASPSAESDHTDDLYFRRGRTKTKRRKASDPNQLDLFKTPKGA
jgi:hypothetical protein